MPKLVTEKGATIDDAVSVKLSGIDFDGWKTVQIETRLNTIAQSFQLEVLDRWKQEQRSWPLRPGKSVEIYVSGELILTGYVDKLDVNATGGSRQFQISGRSKTADLVDCSAMVEQYEFNNLTLDRLAAILLEPFGISVTAKTDVGKAFEKIVLKPGDTPWEFLEKLSRFRGLLLVGTNEGNVEIIKPGSKRSASDIVQGQNMLSISASYDDTNRFSEYVCISSAAGNDLKSPEAAADVQGSVLDSGITRFRPLIIVGEADSNDESSATRAVWEQTIRAAKACKLTCSVQGWFRQNNTLWQPNEIVKVQSPMAGIKSDFLIESVTFKKDGGGTVTSLECVRPDAYSSKGSLDGSLDPKTMLTGDANGEDDGEGDE